MAKREWISQHDGLYRVPSGMVYARASVPGVGRKEFSLEKECADPIDQITERQIRLLIAARDRKIAEMIREKKPTPAGLVRFEDLAKEVIDSKLKKAAKTHESAVTHLENHLIPWMNARYPYLYEWNDKGETLWQEYIDSKRAENPGMKFLNHRKHLRMVLLRAFERRIIERKIHLYDPDPEIDVGRALSADEVKRLYFAASPILKDQILMAFTMGFRKSEILRLEWDRVDFEANEIILHKKHTKTRKPRQVPMNSWVRAALMSRYQKRKESPFVFPSRYNSSEYQKSNKTAWGATKTRAKVDCRFHDLRHTFITNAIRGGMNSLLVCKYAGVSPEVMAKVYLHLDSSDLRKMSDGFGGQLGATLEIGGTYSEKTQ